MRPVANAILGVLALGACNTGAADSRDRGRAGATGTTTGTAGAGGTTDGTGSAGTGGGAEVGAGGIGLTAGAAGAAGSASVGSAGTTGMAGSLAAAGTTGSAGSTGTAGTSGVAGAGGSEMPGPGGTMGGAGGAAASTSRQGPFKIIVLSQALDYQHGSIGAGLTMLQDLGKATAPERAKIPGLAADSTWTVDPIGTRLSNSDYLSEVTADNLRKYELFYSNNPSGAVFTNAPDGAQKKQIFVDYWDSGGSWAGHHSATDFERANGGTSWTWFHDNIDGAYFVQHDLARSPGMVTWQPDYLNHPILKGLTSPWNTDDEWFIMNRDVETVPGFKVIAKVTVTSSPHRSAPRPAVWIRENANGNGGRSFYTIRGHDPRVFAEPQFRDLMLRGILWSVHRLPGGD